MSLSKCHYCGIELTELNYSKDHFISRKNGGTNRVENLVDCCKSCNSSKGSQKIDDFKLRKSFAYAGCPHKFTKSQIEWLLSDFNQEFIDRAREFKFYFEGKK